MMEAIELKTVCPWCDSCWPHQTSTTEPGRRPQAGDQAICVLCRRVAVYTAGPDGVEDGVRRPTDLESAEIAADPQVQRALGALLVSTSVLEALLRTRAAARSRS